MPRKDAMSDLYRAILDSQYEVPTSNVYLLHFYQQLYRIFLLKGALGQKKHQYCHQGLLALAKLTSEQQDRV